MRDNARAGASCQVNTKELTWGDTAVDEKEVGRYDLVLGADICYDPSGVPPLLRLAPQWCPIDARPSTACGASHRAARSLGAWP